MSEDKNWWEGMSDDNVWLKLRETKQIFDRIPYDFIPDVPFSFGVVLAIGLALLIVCGVFTSGRI